MEWQAFLDCFDSAVRSNPKLCNIDKMKSEKAQPCHQIHYLPHHCFVRVESQQPSFALCIVYQQEEMGQY